MSNVFVLDTNKQPLDPVDPGKARILLTRGKAAVYRRYPFTIILKSALDDPVVADLRIKIDPGSKTTSIAIVNDTTGKVVYAAELSHQGEAIKKRLDKRRGVRRSRRNRQTRYRKARWANRRNKKKGWLPPSLQSRITNTITWVSRFMWVCHITNMSLESVKFDMQAMENAEISGVDKCGFTYGNPKQAGRKKGFKTGDMVKAIVTEGKHVGVYVGRVAARATGSFNVTTKAGTTQGIGYQYCRALHRSDGYSYQKGAAVVLAQPDAEAVSAST